MQRIRKEAGEGARLLVREPLWVAGVALYWGEGDKNPKQMLAITNADPAVLRVFMFWTTEYLDPNPSWVLSLNLHQGNDEREARDHWAAELGFDRPQFTKSFIKPVGSGHRKNHLPQGVCRVRLRRSADSWHRAMAWIEAIEALLPEQIFT